MEQSVIVRVALVGRVDWEENEKQALMKHFSGREVERTSWLSPNGEYRFCQRAFSYDVVLIGKDQAVPQWVLECGPPVIVLTESGLQQFVAKDTLKPLEALL